jgi:hypothetical protein
MKIGITGAASLVGQNFIANGDSPNRLQLIEQSSRWKCAPSHPHRSRGINESMSIDRTMHSLIGVSKAFANLTVQVCGRHLGISTVLLSWRLSDRAGAFLARCCTAS